MSAGNGNSGKLKLLVVIASYGEKNLSYLRRIISTYQQMNLQVRIVVLSEKEKDLGPGVEQVVGLPTKDPWSLPFGHKKIFADNVEHFDLFAYSEDDMEVTEKNVRAFLAVTPALNEDEIAGYLRFETDSSGNISIPEAHGAARWKPESVGRRGSFTVAEFSNEHAAFYLLTQKQLKAAIASGGFLKKPHAGRYDMLCSAATDAYIHCGFRKVICISSLDAFLIHHLPNRYAGNLGSALPEFIEQVHTLMCIAQGAHPVRTLAPLEPKILQSCWSKDFYEVANKEMLKAIPLTASEVLSIGCGSGDLESKLVSVGLSVTAMPLDSVIGAAAARRGVKVVHGSMEEGFEMLNDRRFDLILLNHLLPLIEQPYRVLERCIHLLKPNGRLIVSAPNLDLLPILWRRALGLGEYGKLRSFQLSGIHPIAATELERWMRAQGLTVHRPTWTNSREHQTTSGALHPWQKLRSRLGTRLFRNGKGRFTADTWIVSADRGSR